MKKVLFIVRAFDLSAPQPIRFQNIIAHLKENFNIHLLMMTHGDNAISAIDGITIHKVRYSWLGRKLNPTTESTTSITVKRNNASIKSFYKLLKLNKIKKFFFPDVLIIERGRIIKEAIDIINKETIGVVVGSGFPHTVLSIAKPLKKKFRTLEIIYDTGDPFYQNSVNGKIRDFLARIYENFFLNYINKLVVTNEITKQHYIKTYNMLNQKNVHVIPMGMRKIKEEKKTLNLADNTLKLVYAGQFYKKLREPDNLFRAIDNFNQSNNNKKVTLDLFGYISTEFFVKNEHIKFHGKIDNIELLNSYNKFDMAVFIDNKFGFQTPGKVFELLSIDVPILCIYSNPNSPAMEVLEKYDNAIKVLNQENEIIEILYYIFNNEFIFDFPINIQNYLWENIASMYKDVLDIKK